MLDGEGQPGPDTGDTPQGGEAKTTLTGDEAVLAELQSKLESEEADDGAQEGDAGDGQSDDDELEDWEDDGKTRKVPKSLKPHLMREKDYRQKTMEVAEHRKAVEAQKAAVESEAKFHRENVREVAKLVTLDEQLSAFRAITPERWAEIERTNPTQAASLSRQFNLLKDQRENLVGELQQKQQQKASEAQQETAKRYATSLARIAKEIPGWSDELAGKLNEYAVKQGYTLDELQEHVLHPQRVSTIHKAYLFDQLMARTRAKTKPEAAPVVTVVPNITSRRAPAVKDPNKMSPEEYRTWRTNGGGSPRSAAR